MKRLTKQMESGEWIADCKREDAIAKLAEYESAEEEGRFLVLPCKVYDDLFIPNFETNGVDRHRVKAIHVSESGKPILVLESFIVFPESIGKYVFLTEEEAQEAMEV